MVFCNPYEIAHDSTLTVEGCSLFHFGLLASAMFLAWAGAVSGRIKSDFRMSVETVYNTFPWPDEPVASKRTTIEDTAQSILDTIDGYAPQTLATLYDPISMPPELTTPRRALDRAVDSLFSRKKLKSDADRLAILFERYQTLAPLTLLS